MTNLVLESAPATAQKPFKFPSLQVDNLRHIHDHGMTVQFAAPKLSALVRYLAERDGKFVLTAGKSTLEVTRLGAVTFTKIFLSVGSLTKYAVHYSDAPAGLSFSFHQGDEKTETARRALEAVILGEPLPDFFRPQWGKCQDELRAWLAKYAWTLAGAHGLRAQALETRTKRADDDARGAINSLEFENRMLVNARHETTPERFLARAEDARESAQRSLAHVDAQLVELGGYLATLTAPEALSQVDTLAQIAPSVGAITGWEGKVYFNGEEDRFSHPIQAPNYKATVQGEMISFSSGIVCEFGFSELVDWLKGEAPAPVSRYGTVARLAVGAPGTLEPRVYLTCGCHRIDAANDAPALAEYLRPSHQVTRTSGKPRLELDRRNPAPFLARTLEEIQARQAEKTLRRAQIVTGYAVARHQLENERADVPALLAKHEKAVADAQARQNSAVAAAELVKKSTPLGASVERVHGIVLTLVSALLGKGVRE